jgi:hypothetical protein
MGFLEAKNQIPIHLGSSETTFIPRGVLYNFPFFRPDQRLALAQEQGIRPINFEQISTQFTQEQLEYAVLFDSIKSGTIPGNHYRLVFKSEKSSLAIISHPLIDIQLCGGFGNYDIDGFPTLRISQFDILFTGLSLQHYSINQKPATLKEVHDEISKANVSKHGFIYPDSIKYQGEEIFWADANGNLMKMNEHPLFQE